ncbi:MAG: ABC transporter permease [Candidatus Rokubacteria bacterium]|nr:ABC transporter permease [Candidatus Rokubacteria bacterium]MBI3827378.1 ABC transporter permease [Candidatus Rokubacteria bacterium]
MSWRAEAVAVWAFALRNLQMASRNVFLIFEILFWPVLGVLMIGLMTSFLRLTPESTAFLLIGQITMSTVHVCQLDVAYSVLYDVWSKSIKHGFLAPIGVHHLTLGSWLVGMLRGLVVFALAAALGRWTFGFHPLQPGVLALATFLAGCFLTAWVVSVSVCALIMLLGARAETAAWACVNFILVLAGIYYPIDVLPGPVAAVAMAIPLTYFLDAYRAHFGFPSSFTAPVATGFALSAAYAALSHWALWAAVRHARRSGLLLKMSE